MPLRTAEFFLSKRKTLNLCRNRVSVFGGIDWNRTSDTRIFSPLLYHLSYDAIPVLFRIGSAKLVRILKIPITLYQIGKMLSGSFNV